MGTHVGCSTCLPRALKRSNGEAILAKRLRAMFQNKLYAMLIISTHRNVAGVGVISTTVPQISSDSGLHFFLHRALSLSYGRRRLDPPAAAN
nr:hypothetical protein Iba_chr01dCG6460 [Ipomoea batatas]